MLLSKHITYSDSVMKRSMFPGLWLLLLCFCESGQEGNSINRNLWTEMGREQKPCNGRPHGERHGDRNEQSSMAGL